MTGGRWWRQVSATVREAVLTTDWELVSRDHQLLNNQHSTMHFLTVTFMKQVYKQNNIIFLYCTVYYIERDNILTMICRYSIAIETNLTLAKCTLTFALNVWKKQNIVVLFIVEIVGTTVNCWNKNEILKIPFS